MATETTVESIEQLQFELEGSRKAENLLAHFDRYSASRRERSVARPDVLLPLVRGWGRRLIAACTENSIRQYETLLRVELTFPPSSDYGILIVPASQILEAELDRLLVTPARAILQSMIDALLYSRAYQRQAKILEEWAERSFQATLGTASLTLLALRYGYEQDNLTIKEFISKHFREVYGALLRSGDLGKCVDVIRDQFRNPACHGRAIFNGLEYAQFMSLMFANDSAVNWDLQGPSMAEPPASKGVFYHHLQNSLQTYLPAEVDITPLERLLTLKPPSNPPAQIRLQVEPALPASKSRDIGLQESVLNPRFHIGDAIRLRFSSDRDVYAAVIDVGTSGAVTVLWPNTWQQHGCLRPDQPCVIPPGEGPSFHLVLQGHAGQEWIVVVASVNPLPPLLAQPVGKGFRALQGVDITTLLEAMQGLTSGTWTVIHRCFCILP